MNENMSETIFHTRHKMCSRTVWPSPPKPRREFEPAMLKENLTPHYCSLGSVLLKVKIYRRENFNLNFGVLHQDKVGLAALCCPPKLDP